eukprot:TRINITY_DN2021_c0_g1_i15.p1 TRINITY_DN2021_c0_g1~~TRINITY_DN2021_c0_g1_i15.p1  ORF type:complete len:256 (+),score=50.35 TRINITY_DN2021_c0_g1_i15:943-1710(+)
MFSTFQSYNNPESPVVLVAWFVGFSVVNLLLSVVCKRIGGMCDEGKRGTLCMYFANELVCSLVYFAYFRTIFEEVKLVWQFCVLQSLHALIEWVIYPCRCTRTYLTMVQLVSRTLHRWPAAQEVVVLALLPPGCSSLDFLQQWICNELIVRCYAFVFTSISFLLKVGFTSEGYDSAQYSTSWTDTSRVLIFLGTALVLDLANWMLMEMVFFRSKGQTLLLWESGLFVQRGWSLFVYAFAATVFLCSIFAVERWPS